MLMVCVVEVLVVSSYNELDANLRMYGASQQDMTLVLVAPGFPAIQSRMSCNFCGGW
jgi:hypothetical protein